MISLDRAGAALGRPVALALLLILGCTQSARAQIVNPDFWGTDGTVTAIARSGNTVYLGGYFSSVHRMTGGGVPLRAADGTLAPRFGKVAGGLGFTALLFPASSGATKLARNINEFLNSPANFLEISLHARPAVAENFAGAALIPVDAAGLDHLVKEPTLFAPATYFSLGLQSHGHVFHLCLMI